MGIENNPELGGEAAANNELSPGAMAARAAFRRLLSGANRDEVVSDLVAMPPEEYLNAAGEMDEITARLDRSIFGENGTVE